MPDDVRCGASEPYDCSHLDDAALRRLAAIERWQAEPDGRYEEELRHRERLRAADPSTAPKKTAEEILEALDENGRERTEIERMIQRLKRDQPWVIWSGFPWERESGWGPDDSGFPGNRDRSIVHMDW